MKKLLGFYMPRKWMVVHPHCPRTCVLFKADREHQRSPQIQIARFRNKVLAEVSNFIWGIWIVDFPCQRLIHVLNFALS